LGGKARMAKLGNSNAGKNDVRRCSRLGGKFRKKRIGREGKGMQWREERRQPES